MTARRSSLRAWMLTLIAPCPVPSMTPQRTARHADSPQSAQSLGELFRSAVVQVLVRRQNVLAGPHSMVARRVSEGGRVPGVKSLLSVTPVSGVCSGSRDPEQEEPVSQQPESADQ